MVISNEGSAHCRGCDGACQASGRNLDATHHKKGPQNSPVVAAAVQTASRCCGRLALGDSPLRQIRHYSSFKAISDKNLQSFLRMRAMNALFWCLVVVTFLPFVLAMVAGKLRKDQMGFIDNKTP